MLLSASRWLPITLWKYHLVTIEEVGELFDWLTNAWESARHESLHNRC
ncbi:MAG: DUF2949 domain-containing protein [Phormidesmis sp.]